MNNFYISAMSGDGHISRHGHRTPRWKYICTFPTWRISIGPTLRHWYARYLGYGESVEYKRPLVMACDSVIQDMW